MKPVFINRKYLVVFDEYAKKHYEKDFKKKYKGAWPSTKKSIEETLERISNLDGLDVLDPICKTNKDTFLFKFDFSIAKSNLSAKGSGNRCILEVCNNSCCVKIILIYCKGHIDRPDKQETLWWKEKMLDEFGLSCSC